MGERGVGLAIFVRPGRLVVSATLELDEDFLLSPGLGNWKTDFFLCF